MDNFSFYSPTEFVFGKDTENNCGKYVKKYGGSRVLIHYGSFLCYWNCGRRCLLCFSQSKAYQRV